MLKKKLITVLFAAALPFFAQGSTYDDLIQGAKLGDSSAIGRLLARGASADTTDIEGNTLLMLAARDGHVQLAELLVSYRAKLNARNAAGDTALALAALRGHQRVVEILVAAGASQEVPGWPPLVYAAFGGHLDTVVFLLRHGANVDAVSESGMSALMAAARGGFLPIVKALLEAKANTELRTDRGESALDIALRFNNTDIAEQLRAVSAQQATKPAQ